jgi:hypothetical protein
LAVVAAAVAPAVATANPPPDAPEPEAVLAVKAKAHFMEQTSIVSNDTHAEREDAWHRLEVGRMEDVDVAHVLEVMAWIIIDWPRATAESSKRPIFRYLMKMLLTAGLEQCLLQTITFPSSDWVEMTPFQWMCYHAPDMVVALIDALPTFNTNVVIPGAGSTLDWVTHDCDSRALPLYEMLLDRADDGMLNGLYSGGRHSFFLTVRASNYCDSMDRALELVGRHVLDDGTLVCLTHGVVTEALAQATSPTVKDRVKSLWARVSAYRSAFHCALNGALGHHLITPLLSLVSAYAVRSELPQATELTPNYTPPSATSADAAAAAAAAAK